MSEKPVAVMSFDPANPEEDARYRTVLASPKMVAALHYHFGSFKKESEEAETHYRHTAHNWPGLLLPGIAETFSDEFLGKELAWLTTKAKPHSMSAITIPFHTAKQAEIGQAASRIEEFIHWYLGYLTRAANATATVRWSGMHPILETELAKRDLSHVVHLPSAEATPTRQSRPKDRRLPWQRRAR